MKWQDVKNLGLNLFKKKSRSRRLWIGGSGLTVFGVLAYVFLLTGVDITTSGDIICGETCEIYANITSTYWETCFDDVDFAPLYFNQTPIKYEVLVPTRGKDNWRPLKVGDCIKRKNKYNYLPNRFKIIIEKNPWQTIKYGVEFKGTDIDPFLYSENVKIIKNKTYEKLCDEIMGMIPTIIPYEVPCEKGNATCIGNKTLKRVEYNEGVVDCVLNGKVKIDNRIIEKDNFLCDLDDQGIICDEYKDDLGGGGDGNGDGECQPGETCIRY